MQGAAAASHTLDDWMRAGAARAEFVYERTRHDGLERLLRSAAKERREARREISLGVQARVIAAWRAGRHEGATLLRMLRQAVAAAAVVSSVTVAFTFAVVDRNRGEPEPQVAWLTNSPQGMELSWIQAEAVRHSGIEPEYP